jgi:hypothetical protein
MATQKSISEVRYRAYLLHEYNEALANKIEARMGEVLRLIERRIEALSRAGVDGLTNDRVAVEREFISRRRRPKVNYPVQPPHGADAESAEDGVSLFNLTVIANS